MSVPSSDVHETDTVLIAHQPGDSLRLELETFDADRVASRGGHLLFEHLHRLRHVAAQLESAADRRLEGMAGVHVVEDPDLPVVEGRFTDTLQGQVGSLPGPLECKGEGIGEGDGGSVVALGRVNARRSGYGTSRTANGFVQPGEKTGAKVMAALGGLTELDTVLRFEVTAREILGPGERNEGRLTLLIQRTDGVAQRRRECPVRVQLQRPRRILGTRPCDSDRRARLVIEAAGMGNQHVGRVVATPEKDQQEAGAIGCGGV